MTSEELEKLLACCRLLPAAQETYLESDFVTNLLATVVDYQMQTKAVIQAMQHFKTQPYKEVRTLADLKRVLTKFPDDREGNESAAIFLWGYRLWTRLAQLRRLVAYFESIGVTTQEDLVRWAQSSQVSDFLGKVKGLGPAVYQWLVMRQGVETIKPDTHVLRFVAECIGRPVREWEAINSLEEIAQKLGRKAYELDWSIWEFQRAKP